MASQLYFSRARALVIIPAFTRLPGDGPMRLILIKAMRLLRHKASTSEAEAINSMAKQQAPVGVEELTLAAGSSAPPRLPHIQAAKLVAAHALDSVLKTGVLGDCDYFSRAWTLMERTARHGHNESLCSWLSLEAWLGVVVNTLLQGVSEGGDHVAATRRMLDGEGRALFDSLLPPLAEAIETGSILIPACEGMVDSMMRLMEVAAEVWASRDTTSPPNPAWIRQYLLEDLPQGIYCATFPADLIWSAYSFLSTKWDVDLSCAEGVRGALEDLAYVGGVADDMRGAPEPALKEGGFTVCSKLYETLGLEALLGDKLGPIRKVWTESHIWMKLSATNLYFYCEIMRVES